MGTSLEDSATPATRQLFDSATTARERVRANSMLIGDVLDDDALPTLSIDDATMAEIHEEVAAASSDS